MKETIGKQIRKFRDIKGYSQENVATELDMSHSAYAKIERGVTDTPVTRLIQIAEILEVDVREFFSELRQKINIVHEPDPPYGYASKTEVEDLKKMLTSLKTEIEKLRAVVPVKPAKAKQGRKHT